MFYFVHTEQSADNASHLRGKLFEDLVARYLSTVGYEDIEMRKKHHSLEYDVEGRHRTDRRKVVGEAKAHEATITGKDIASFVGKLAPLYYGDNDISGLFLSTSPLSPDADDYLRDVQEKAPFRIVDQCAEKLERSITRALKLPSFEEAERRVSHAIPVALAHHIVHTDLGTFLTVSGCHDEGAFPDRFAVIREDGSVVDDVDFLRIIRGFVDPFRDLETVPLMGPARSEVQPREIPRGIVQSSTWVDFRHPAGPDHFVGRGEELERVRGAVEDHGDSRIVEIKSRSGVGKSSLILVLASLWQRAGHEVELHDARDVHSVSDLFALVARFAGVSSPVTTFQAMERALESLEASVGAKRAFLVVDQFESTFQSPQIFNAYEYLALSIARRGGRIHFVFTRKDDLLTTHDDLQVDVDRLTGFAHTFTLTDMTRREASELLRAIAEAYPRSLSSDILAQVLEFAQGFPWLLKRTMAHVVELLEVGVSQQELESSGLHLQDLFEEEVEGLDEMERGYLVRLAAALPATYRVLIQRYENDPMLPKMLEQLTKKRILRLSAGTYDTYNDVFKDYILYERLPERSHSHLFRMTPPPVLEAFRALGGSRMIDLDEFRKNTGRPLGSTYNILREMRVVGLVARTGKGWEVPDTVRDYEHEGRLGEYVRQAVMKNHAVTAFLHKLETEGPIRRERTATFLKEHFAFVEAQDEVWETYARHFLAWLSTLRIVESAGGLVCPDDAERSEVVESLGNLRLLSRGSRPEAAEFVPSQGWATCVRLLSRGTVRLDSLRKGERVAALELEKIGAMRREGDRMRAVWDESRLREWSEERLGQAPYTEFWSLLTEGMPYQDALAHAFGFTDLAPGTRETLGKKLANWGRELGFIPRRLRIKSGSAG